MARPRFDIGSKWLLHNQGRGAALVGGLKNVRRCEPMPGEITAALSVRWRTVELWTLPTEQFLAEADVSVLPWVP